MHHNNSSPGKRVCAWISNIARGRPLRTHSRAREKVGPTQPHGFYPRQEGWHGYYGAITVLFTTLCQTKADHPGGLAGPLPRVPFHREPSPAPAPDGESCSGPSCGTVIMLLKPCISFPHRKKMETRERWILITHASTTTVTYFFLYCLNIISNIS